MAASDGTVSQANFTTVQQARAAETSLPCPACHPLGSGELLRAQREDNSARPGARRHPVARAGLANPPAAP